MYLYNPIISFQSKVNIANVVNILGVRQIQKRITSSGFTKTVDIQVSYNLKTVICKFLRGTLGWVMK